MITEDHSNEVYQGKCPHCGSLVIYEFPAMNLFRINQCLDCEWVFTFDLRDLIFKVVYKDEKHELPKKMRDALNGLTTEQKLKLLYPTEIKDDIKKNGGW